MKDHGQVLVPSQVLLAPVTSTPEKQLKLADAFNPLVNLRGLWRRPEGALNCLDGLRAIAVIWVVVYHCFSVWAGLGGRSSGPGPWQDIYLSFPVQLVLNGELGVDIFFSLSGFLIALQSVRELRRNGCISFPAFVWARWWRIAPTYYAALLFMAVTDIKGYAMRSNCAQSWWLNVLFLNNLQNHGLGIFDNSPNCGVWTWSIAIEFQFYMLTPLVLWLCCGKDGKLRPHCFKTLLGLFLGFQFTCAGLYFGFRTDIEEPALMNNMLWTRGQSYIVGIAACLAYSGVEVQGKHRGFRIVDGLAGLLFITVAFIGNGRNPDQPIAFWSPIARVVCLLLSQGLLAASVSWAAFRMSSGCMPWLDSLLSGSLWVPLARLSYSAYLLQFVAIAPLRAHWQVFPENIGSTEAFVRFLVFCIVSLVMVFAVALVHYLIVEAPSLRLRKRATPQCLARS